MRHRCLGSVKGVDIVFICDICKERKGKIMSKKDYELIDKLKKQAFNMRLTGNKDWAIIVSKAANRLHQLVREREINHD